MKLPLYNPEGLLSGKLGLFATLKFVKVTRTYQILKPALKVWLKAIIVISFRLSYILFSLFDGVSVFMKNLHSIANQKKIFTATANGPISHRMSPKEVLVNKILVVSPKSETQVPILDLGCHLYSVVFYLNREK